MTSFPGQIQQDVYRPAFVKNCLELIVRARQGLAGRSLTTEEEPSITGLLVEQAKAIIESDHAENWMEHLCVLDDPPQNDQSERLGKRRPRIDIEFEQARRGVRPKFHVEAKRLYRSDSLTEYLGAGGLRMFLDGAYASAWPSAGMLGYVQKRGCADWIADLEGRFSAGDAELSVCDHETALLSPNWQTSGLEDVRTSCHLRKDQRLDPIQIFHLLLDCS
jgi:hypothetical protein